MDDDGAVLAGASSEEVEAILGRPPRRSVIRAVGTGSDAGEVEFWVYPARPPGHRTEILFDAHQRVAAVSVRPWRVRWTIRDGTARATVEHG